MTPVSVVVNALEAHGCRPRAKLGNYVAHCPAHEDGNPSLVVSEGDGGKALLRCWAGCETERVVERLGLSMSDLFPATLNPMEAYIR